MITERSAGVLMHITSLPSEYGIGTLGEESYKFADWLESAGMKIWQVLPLVPTNYGDSPYQSVSSTALNYYLIDFDILVNKKLLKKADFISRKFNWVENRVDYSLLFNEKVDVLRIAFSRFNKEDEKFVKFVNKGVYRDFAIFMTIKALNNYNSWTEWPDEYRIYSKEVEEKVIEQFNDDYLFWQWTQYEFLDEWNKLRKYCNKKGIEIMGDMPLYVAYDSVEAWKMPELFILNEDNSPKLVAGCPPDMFSEDGQLWGNPCYDWAYHKKTKYKWWNSRIKDLFKLYDILRIDHFRGMDRFYAIPAEDDTARYGEWLDGPKFDLFKDKLDLKIVAEDLGVVDEGIKLLMEQVQYPGMKILQFGFDGSDDNDHMPSNFKENIIVYTGTHDNMPIFQYIFDLEPAKLAVFLKDLHKEAKLLNMEVHDKTYKEIVSSVIELAFASKANMCIIPMQDLLCQDGSTRMNLPSTVSTDNWSYRVVNGQITNDLANRLKDLVVKYNR